MTCTKPCASFMSTRALRPTFSPWAAWPKPRWCADCSPEHCVARRKLAAHSQSLLLPPRISKLKMREAKNMLSPAHHARTFPIAGSRSVFAQPVHVSVGDFYREGILRIVQSRQSGSAGGPDDCGL